MDPMRVKTTTKSSFGKTVSSMAKEDRTGGLGKRVSQLAALKKAAKPDKPEAPSRPNAPENYGKAMKAAYSKAESEGKLGRGFGEPGGIKPRPTPAVMRVGRRIIK